MNNNQYRVPKQVYFQCVWTVKDIDRLRRLEAIGSYAKKNDEMVYFVDDEEVIRNSDVLSQATWKLGCIRQAVEKIPEEYRQETVDCIAYNLPFGDMAHENTWRKWRQVFIHELAKNLLLI